MELNKVVVEQLKKAGISFEDARKMSKEDLMKIEGIGEKTADEIIKAKSISSTDGKNLKKYRVGDQMIVAANTREAVKKATK